MFRVNSIGVRSGETVVAYTDGKSKAKPNLGTVMLIRGNYPPAKEYVAQLTDLQLRDGLNGISFFAGTTTQERKEWLLSNAIDNKDLYLEDAGIEVKFLEIGGEFFIGKKKRDGKIEGGIGDELVNMLLQGNPADPEGYWSLKEVIDLFPRKPGSRGLKGKHTLVFRPSIWAVRSDEQSVSEFRGLVVDIGTFSFVSTTVQKPDGGYLRSYKTQRLKELVPGFAIYHTELRPDRISWDRLIEISISLTRPEVAGEMSEFRKLVDWAPPSLFKSLLQKCIRTRCKRIAHVLPDGKEVEFKSDAVLLTTLSLLLLHPGSFVPNIQRFVSGIESAAKRLAVSICEDSYVEDGRFLIGMFGAAAIAQQDRNWQPTDTMIKYWFAAGLSAQQDKRMYDYDWHSRRGDTLEVKKWNPYVVCYLLLAEIKSFESDIQMVGSIAEREGQPRPRVPVPIESKSGDLPTVMPLIHCVDQHSFTDIALFIQPPEKWDKSAVYGPIFGRIWDLVAGWNPRKEKYSTFDTKNPEIVEIRTAQRHLWLRKSGSTLLRRVIVPALGTYDFRYNLDPSWLAGLIGPQEIKIGSATAIVVMRCDDITTFTAIRRPSRDKEAPDLTDDEKERAIEAMKRTLHSGLRFKGVPESLSMLKGASISLQTDESGLSEYYLHPIDGKAVPWLKFVEMDFKLPVHAPVEVGVENALLMTGEGVDQYADVRFNEMLKMGKKILSRLLYYLEDNRSFIELAKISRDGTAVDYAVTPEDVGVNTFLCQLCCLYPAVLEMAPNGFKVKCGPLLWFLRDKIRAKIFERVDLLLGEVKMRTWSLPNPYPKPLWEHQKDVVNAMIARHQLGKKGHEIWVPMGLGKTACVLEYLRYLIGRSAMPDYCVYTLPPGPETHIQAELDMMGMEWVMLDMRQDSKNRVLVKGKVNIIWHDHMRVGGFDAQMKEHANNLLFIVDEFHKTMAKTIRSSIALEVTHLAAEFIALSGTVISSGEPDELIRWLSQIVEFEVTRDNYFVAVGALISKRIQTRVNVEYVDIDAPLVDEKAYYSLVPKGLGGTADNIDFRGAVAESYRSVEEELLRQAHFYLSRKEKLFICVKDLRTQEKLRDRLQVLGAGRIHLITKDTPISLRADEPNNIDVVITTIRKVEGYGLTDRRVQINELTFSNQCTRDQRDARLNRIGQPSPVIRIINVMGGILTYVNTKYKKAKSLSEAIKGFAAEVEIGGSDVLRSLIQ